MSPDALTVDIDLLIFDADDTLRRTTIAGQPSPRTPDEWVLLPNVRDTLRVLAAGPDAPRLAVASNQDQVGYGFISEELACQLLRDLVEQATEGRVRNPAVRICPHRLDVPCGCRKPAPGMLLSLLAECDAEPERTLFVGNADSDRAAAAAAGVRFAPAAEFFGW